MGAVPEAVAAVAVLVGLAAVAAAGRGRGWSEEGSGVPGEVTYDHRALVLDGARRMLFAGEMHYPRSTPEVTRISSPPYLSVASLPSSYSYMVARCCCLSSRMILIEVPSGLAASNAGILLPETIDFISSR